MNKILLLILPFILTFCGQVSKNSSAKNDLGYKGQIKLEQYMVKGAKTYQVYCQNCHGKGGQGLSSLYPPLKQADYLLEDLPRAACIIKNGQNKKIIVNGKEYNQMMPAMANLTPLDIAEVITYITNSWGNSEGMTNVKDVEKWLQECE